MHSVLGLVYVRDVREEIRAQIYGDSPLPADPFAREEAWIASGDGSTLLEFLEHRAEPRRPRPDPGIYLWR